MIVKNDSFKIHFMGSNIDFKKIRSHNGSQNNAFEELICQLARLSRPEGAESFIRKEGSGGDAGIECFWKLKDDSEHAWQAKYFLDTITDPQWRQISKSVKTALNKHPNLKKYYICLPLNRTDRKQENKKDLLEKWNKKIAEWKKIAKSKSMNVKFEFWGASEIFSILSRDDPRFSGRALYWFNSPILQIQHLKDITEKSKQSLGERFSQKLNIDLPISKYFEGIGLTPSWYLKFCSIKNHWLKVLGSLINIINKEDKSLTKEWWNPIKDSVFNLEILLKKVINAEFLYENANQLKEIIDNLKQKIKPEFKPTKTEIERKIKRYFNEFSNINSELALFLTSEVMMAFSKKSMLLSGGAGVGKSHLLCDITLNRLDENLPTLFLLGQHYNGDNPLKLISDSLDLNSNSYKEVLGALAALGEAHSTRTMIIIDAINEGSHKESWKDHIISLIIELKKYPYISFVFSCRSTYLKYLLPPQIKDLVVEIEHIGFSDPGHKAVYKYFEKQGIFVPSTPIMNPEFFNPLFLKICCKSLKIKGENKFPKGSRGIRDIFRFYIDSILETISNRKLYRLDKQTVLQALQLFALKLFPNNLYGLSIDEARRTIISSGINGEKGKELIDDLLNEGILSEDIYKDSPIIRFTYERFSDYFIAEALIEKEIKGKPKKFKKNVNLIKYYIFKVLFKRNYPLKSENLKLYFKKDTLIGNIFIDNKFYLFVGIIEALSICIGKCFNMELYDLIETRDINTKFHKPYLKINTLFNFLRRLYIKKIDKNQQYLIALKKKELLEISFTNTILQRSSDSLTNRTLELLKKIPNNSFISPALDILLNLSTEVEHPWNADFLHKILFKQKLYERDKFWSIHIACSYHYNEKLVVKNLIDWPYSANLSNLEAECARLYAITLIWLTTTSYREVRDKATKSAIIILSQHPEHLLELMDTFLKVNDLYVLERLYAITYGVIVNIEDKNLMKRIAEKTYEQIFKEGKPVPHILLRDYARCILEFTHNKGLLSSEINPENFRPPYNSVPIENPMDSEIDALVDDKQYGSVHYSLMGFTGDFGIYTMSCIHSFSPTPLTKQHPETGKELQKKFVDKLSEQQKALYYGQSSEKKDKFMETLNEKQREEKRWLFDDKFMNDRPAAFSRKQAKRWVCKQVYEMGWKKELFGKFEKLMCSRDREGKLIERIGKKYQWIAFHKLLAHLADNVHYIGDWYDDKNEYQGPWQLSIRDIDPTFYLRKTESDLNFETSSTEWWWQPYVLECTTEDVEQQEKWFRSKSTILSFKNLLQVREPKDNSLWTVLHGFVIQQKELHPNKKEEGLYKPECWFRINAILIPKKDRDTFYTQLKNKDFCDPHTVNIGRIDRFLKEYPFCNKEYANNFNSLSVYNIDSNTKYLCPIREYSWESGNADHSIDESISVYLPTKILIDKLKLYYLPGQFEYWVNNDGTPIFKNPSIKSKDPSYALIKTDVLNTWLDQDNLCLIWLIGGEKRLYGKDSMTGKRHVFSGVYFTNGDKIEGTMWFLNIVSW